MKNTVYVHQKRYANKKHSENADTSTSVTSDLVVWPWPIVKVKKTDVNICRLLYCTLVPCMMSMGLTLYEISSCVYFMWPLTFTCDLQLLSRSLDLSCRCTLSCWMSVSKLNFVGTVEFEIWTLFCMEKTWMTSPWCHPPFDFYEIQIQICKVHI